MKERHLAMLAVLGVQILYAATFTFANDLIDSNYIQPYGFILLRVLCAATLFWIINLFVGRQKVAFQDQLKIALCALFGITINMLTFFKGLAFTTPIHASVIMITTPIIVLSLSAFFLGERLTLKKITGIVLGFLGAIFLSVYGATKGLSGDNILLGNTLVLINAISYSIYLILIKGIVDKYHPLTFFKYMFSFGFLFVLPFGFKELKSVDWSVFSGYDFFAVTWVVVGATFATYLLNFFGLKRLNASTVSTFIYLQPLLAGLFAVMLGSDQLDWIKVVSALFIFSGVFLVSQKTPAKQT